MAATRSSVRTERARSRLRRLRLDPAELVVLVVFALVASLPLLLLAWRALVEGRIWPGIDASPVVQDEWQYLNWIRDASEHVLISNHYVAEDTERSYLHPLVLISGGGVQLGLAPAVAYLVWKPVAVVALFAAVRGYVRRLVRPRRERLLALAVALFFFPPAALIAGEGNARLGDPIPLTVVGEGMWSGNALWGYYFSALAVASLVAALLAYERDRSSGRLSARPALLGLLAAWLQPWQGALLIAVILGAEAILRLAPPSEPAPARRPRLALPLLTLAAATAPIVYYFVLSRVDPSWSTANDSYRFLDPPWWAIAVTLAPLALPALLAYRRRPASFHEAALRVWPVAALGVFAVIALLDFGHYAPHALRGLSIPLAVLAVSGLAGAGLSFRRGGALAVAACAALVLTAPATLDRLDDAERRISANSGPFFLTQGERDALDYLDRERTAGSVLARTSMAQLIPAETGRHTNVGHLTWTPDYLRRQLFTDLLFQGQASRRAARTLVRRSGSRFLLSGCDGSADLSRVLGALLASVRRFDCATVYELRPSALMGRRVPPPSASAPRPGSPRPRARARETDPRRRS
jgi:hypothetical protein